MSPETLNDIGQALLEPPVSLQLIVPLTIRLPLTVNTPLTVWSASSGPPSREAKLVVPVTVTFAKANVGTRRMLRAMSIRTDSDRMDLPPRFRLLNLWIGLSDRYFEERRGNLVPFSSAVNPFSRIFFLRGWQEEQTARKKTPDAAEAPGVLHCVESWTAYGQVPWKPPGALVVALTAAALVTVFWLVSKFTTAVVSLAAPP